jgi:hypothetical protein
MALGFGHGLMHLNNHFLFNCQTTGTNRNMRLQQNFLRPTPPRFIKQYEDQKSTPFKLILKKSLSSKNYSAKRIFSPGYIV